MRYFIHLAYNGKAYRGWQRQPDVVSVQEVLEQQLKLMLHQPITCIGCGRTDAEVHASQYFMHIDVEAELDFDAVFRLNKMLPDDIAVFDFIPVEEKAHARYDAKLRTYDYFLHFYKNPFLKDHSSFYQLKSLDFAAMQKAATLLTKYQDFRSLCKRPDLNKHTLCEIKDARLFLNAKGTRLRFQISSNRFLQAMIRLIMGQLLEVGTGKSTLATFESILAEQKPLRYFTLAYPQGLYLSKVNYPFLNVPTKVEFSTPEVEEYWQAI